MFSRKCQECGHRQSARDPRTTKTGRPSEAYLNAKCRHCDSMALDFGSDAYTISANGWVRIPVPDSDNE